MQPDDAIAIVGIGGLFPGAQSLEEFWANVRDGIDSTSDVPRGRWLIEPERVFDPRVALADRVYSLRGGFIERPEVETAGLEVDPALLERLDPVFALSLHVAVQAWNDAQTSRVDRNRVGVVFGNIVLPTETASELTRQTLGSAFEENLGVSSPQNGSTEPCNAFPAGRPASLVAGALGLRGPAYTIDAACASSLYALKLAGDELRSGRADAMLCGGVSRPDSLFTQMGFSQLRALSARGKPAPLDHRGDGLVVGEGAGMFVLKRVHDALAHGDHIYAVVAGIGLANDIHGDLLSPSSEGQVRAMRMAYEQARWNPADVDLIECHATGTPVGDAVEIASLKSLWGQPGSKTGQCAIGSVKSNIGHALTAAGSAGLLKVLLALKNQTLPPTANFDRPSPNLALDSSPFRALTRAEHWPKRGGDQPRRAAISGFGFGGINCHVLIEEWDASLNKGTSDVDLRPTGARSRPLAKAPVTPLAIVGLAAHFGPFDDTERFHDRVLGYDGERPAESPRNWWGISESMEFTGQGGGDHRGFYINSLEFDVGQFRIPPKELAEMQPQQSLMLRVAARAIADARWNANTALRTGVLIGIGLDLNTTNFQLRWLVADRAKGWNEALGLGLTHDELARWVDELTRAAGPALTANGTMGSLGGLIASRIAREFKIGGPSFTVSCDETSGIQALAIAANWLRTGQLDAAIVGAVDFAGDPRAVLARERIRSRPTNSPCACDGAVALVLKRADDARRDGDQILALVGDVFLGCEQRRANPHTGEHRGDPRVVEVSSIEADLGAAGAATGLATVAKAVLCLRHRILPPSIARVGPSFWMRNRAEGPRSAGVQISSLGDKHADVTLAECDENRLTTAQHVIRPALPAGLFAIEAGDIEGIRRQIRELSELVQNGSGQRIDTLASEWWQRHLNDPRLPLGFAIVAESVDKLRERLDRVSRENHGQGVHERLAPNRLAFVYPGLGNQFAGMGRVLSSLWPDVLDQQDSESEQLREQLDPLLWWQGQLPRAFSDHVDPILGSVSVSAFVTDVFRSLGVHPDAAIGYSLGESAALVALRAWTDRDSLLRRLQSSPLFKTELAGPCDAARRLWNLASDQPVDWVAGIVPRSVDSVRAAMADQARVYALIRNLPEETVIGGEKSAVAAVVKQLGCPFVELSPVSTVHCAIGRTVEQQYHALHHLTTTASPGIEFYSGAWGRAYAVDSASAADAITALAVSTIDFPALIERAYDDGIRFFLEVGPGASCTRMISQILRGRPHTAISACRPDRDELATVLDVLAELITHRLPVNLDRLYGDRNEGTTELVKTNARPATKERPKVRVAVRAASFKPPLLGGRQVATIAENHRRMTSNRSQPPPASRASFAEEQNDPSLGVPFKNAIPAGSELMRAVESAQRAKGEAHEAFLRVMHGASDLIGRNIAYQLQLIKDHQCATPATLELADEKSPISEIDGEPLLHERSVFLDREQCLEFAIGSIGAVLGPDFVEIDQFPTRVRLPDDPLMLVDRIVSVEGEPRSLEKGRVVTEHVIEPGAWYLDGGRVAPCIAIEAGQADLFLCGYLGIDFETKGLAVYRLLDATVTFHRRLPTAGQVIHYDIRISEFFRQGKTILFRFQFDATVAGEPLLTMRDGCAGFFTSEELAAGKGIVPRSLDSKRIARPATSDAADLIAMSSTTLDENQVDALRRGDLATAFGAPFDRMALRDPLPLPGGRMNLVHRVTALEPAGGRFGMGFICAEADIHPGDWFMVCHFIDDRVMPGTLMYECCLHTLRIFMMRLGWLGSSGKVAFEPVTGIANRLQCRGQIIETTRVVAYEVTIKERGYRPEPYAIADALIVADGKPIVAVTDMALQLTGTDKHELERLWAEPTQSVLERAGQVETARVGADALAATDGGRAIFDYDQILAFATGKPSVAFGERYLPFDDRRFIARLPGPPYQFVDRIVRLDAKPWVMAPGGSAEAEFDVAPDAWHFAADRQDRMPFAVLLEVALQACGWMSAYMGSALTSDHDLKFRNLGGVGRQHLPVTRQTGTLTTRVRVTKISSAAGMILQHYDFSVQSREGLVYDGSTEFGFFDPAALEQQIGIRDAKPYQLSDDDRARAESFEFPSGPPFPDGRWRMIDRVLALAPESGPHAAGIVVGSTNVDPAAWFFKAHFLGDPVWPGSLGLESLLQLLKIVAAKRWGGGPSSVFESPSLGQSHRWTYRGQIVPANRLVEVQAEIKLCDDRSRLLVADGYLKVEGKVIYQMTDLSMRLADT